MIRLTTILTALSVAVNTAHAAALRPHTADTNTTPSSVSLLAPRFTDPSGCIGGASSGTQTVVFHGSNLNIYYLYIQPNTVYRNLGGLKPELHCGVMLHDGGYDCTSCAVDIKDVTVELPGSCQIELRKADGGEDSINVVVGETKEYFDSGVTPVGIACYKPSLTTPTAGLAASATACDSVKTADTTPQPNAATVTALEVRTENSPGCLKFPDYILMHFYTATGSFGHVPARTNFSMYMGTNNVYFDTSTEFSCLANIPIPDNETQCGKCPTLITGVKLIGLAVCTVRVVAKDGKIEDWTLTDTKQKISWEQEATLVGINCAKRSGDGPAIDGAPLDMPEVLDTVDVGAHTTIQDQALAARADNTPGCIQYPKAIAMTLRRSGSPWSGLVYVDTNNQWHDFATFSCWHIQKSADTDVCGAYDARTSYIEIVGSGRRHVRARAYDAPNDSSPAEEVFIDVRRSFAWVDKPRTIEAVKCEYYID